MASSVDEQESLLKSYYADEKDPDTKDVAHDGAEKNENEDSSAVSNGFPPVIAIGTPPPPPPPPHPSASSSYIYGHRSERSDRHRGSPPPPSAYKRSRREEDYGPDRR